MSNNLGETYVYYAPSQMEGADKLRTLLGKFWHHDTENNKSQYGFRYNSRTQKKIESLMNNFISDMKARHDVLASQADSPSIRRMVRLKLRKNMLDQPIYSSKVLDDGTIERTSQDPQFRLPSNWFRISRKYGNVSGFERLSAGENLTSDPTRSPFFQAIFGNDGFTGSAEHEVYEIQLNKHFSQNFRYPPVVVVGRRLQSDDRYEYKRIASQPRIFNAPARLPQKVKEPTLSEKHKTAFTRGGLRSFVIRHMFNRVQRYINTNLGLQFEDYFFGITTPIDKVLADNMNSGAGNIKISTANQDCHYNYYLENFEKRMSANPDVSEAHLPNPYLVNFIDTQKSVRRTGGHSKADGDLYKLASCFKNIPNEKISIRVGKNDEQVLKAPRRIGRGRKKKRKTTSANSAYMEYLELYSEAFTEMTQDKKDRLEQKQSNVVFGAMDYSLLQNVCSRSDNIPFGAMVEFTTPKTESEDLANKLFKSGLCSIIMSKAIEYTLELRNRGESEEDYLSKSGWMTEYPNVEVSKYKAVQPALNAQVEVASSQLSKSDGLPSFDLLKLLNKFATSAHGSGMAVLDGIDDLVEQVSTIIHDGTEFDAFQSDMSYFTSGNTKAKKTKGALAAFILLGQIKKIAKQAERSWHRLASGFHGKSKNEILFYEIEKTRVLDNGSSEVVQRFWVPNFSDQEKIKFFDAQVKFDRTYKYQISSWTAVFGTRYSYTGMAEDFDLDPNGRWAFGVYTDPFVKLVRIPYKTLEPIQIRDFPPIPPNVDIIPYRATRDKFIVNLTVGVDDYKQAPQTILETDQQMFDKCYRAQYGFERSRTLAMFSDNPAVNTPLRFKSDDLPKHFQIFRLTNSAPTKWNDFSGAYTSQLNVEDGETSSIELVSPNTDYYYMFRSVDIHGNVSNPSPIYKVRINDGQGIFTEVESYDFEKDKVLDRSFAKTVNRNIQITPVFEQIVFKDDRQAESKKTIANQQKIRLGVAQDSIYGKKLKFRITSRKSGRKVDLNVSFTHTHKKPERD